MEKTAGEKGRRREAGREGGRAGDFGGKCVSRREGRCKERKCERARIYVVTLSDALLNVTLKSSRHLITHGKKKVWDWG